MGLGTLETIPTYTSITVYSFQNSHNTFDLSCHLFGVTGWGLIKAGEQGLFWFWYISVGKLTADSGQRKQTMMLWHSTDYIWYISGIWYLIYSQCQTIGGQDDILTKSNDIEANKINKRLHLDREEWQQWVFRVSIILSLGSDRLR